VLLVSFAAMVGMAGYALAADPAPAGAKAAPATSHAEARRQAVEMEKKEQEKRDQMERHAEEIYRRRLDYIQEQRLMRGEIIKSCDVSPENVLPLLLALEKDWLGLKTEATLKEKREMAIEAMVAKAAEETDKGTKADVVLQHLMKIVEMQGIALKEAQSAHKMGALSEADLRKAEADLAEAQIRVELRKEELAKSPAHAEAGRLAQQARELRLELTMDILRLDILEKKLHKLRKARDMLDDYNRISEVELPALNQELLELRIHSIQSH
jgi:hypothetical protein